MSEIDLKLRRSTHGLWDVQAVTAQALKEIVRAQLGAKHTPAQREAVEMICVKISRICCGNPDTPDHWLDIQGYAKLGLQGDHK